MHSLHDGMHAHTDWTSRLKKKTERGGTIDPHSDEGKLLVVYLTVKRGQSCLTFEGKAEALLHHLLGPIKPFNKETEQRNKNST